jgi:nicotinate-nucleotide adenylyltransferase
MKIGILGGTFDPIHNGHILIAEAARDYLGLAKVLFVPAGQPWLKAGRSVSDIKDRLQMVRLAICGRPYFELSTIEVERWGPTYTVDTITLFHDQYGIGNSLYLILGWDSLADITKWKEPSRLVNMCYLVGVPRSGYPAPDIQSLEHVVPGLSQNIILIEWYGIDISASRIRQRVICGLPIAHLVPEAVGGYIREKKLYLHQDDTD